MIEGQNYRVFEASFCTWDLFEIPDGLAPRQDVGILHFRNNFAPNYGVGCWLLDPGSRTMESSYKLDYVFFMNMNLS